MEAWATIESVGLIPPATGRNRRPPDVEVAAPPRPAASANAAGTIAAGYICSGISLLLFPPAFGVAAFILAIVNLARGHLAHGLAQIILSFVCTLVGMFLGAALVG